MNAINERLINAHSLRYSMIDNALAFFTLQLSHIFLSSHYDKVRVLAPVLPLYLTRPRSLQEMLRLRELIEVLNRTVYNPVGLNILWPRQVAFMFVRPHISSIIISADSLSSWRSSTT